MHVYVCEHVTLWAHGRGLLWAYECAHILSCTSCIYTYAYVYTYVDNIYTFMTAEKVRLEDPPRAPWHTNVADFCREK